jgi:hypothetical protein
MFSPRRKRLLGSAVYRSLIGPMNEREAIGLPGEAGDLRGLGSRTGPQRPDAPREGNTFPQLVFGTRPELHYNLSSIQTRNPIRTRCTKHSSASGSRHSR